MDRINALRVIHSLPLYVPGDVNDDTEILTQVIVERSRELFLKGHRINDMIGYKDVLSVIN